MDLFDRAENEPNALKRAARYYYAMVGRLAWSAGHGLTTYLYAEGSDEFWRIATVENLWAFCLIIAGWFLVSSVPVVGTAVNLYLSVYGLKEIWDRIERAKGAFVQWYPAAHEAKTQEDLQAAARHFAQGFAVGGLTLLELVVSRGTLKIVARLIRKFPIPAWFREMHAKALRKRAEKRSTETGASKRSSAPTASRPRAGDFAPLLLPVEGAKKVAETSPVVPVLVGTALTLGVAGLTLWAVTSETKRR